MEVNVFGNNQTTIKATNEKKEIIT